MNFKAMSLLSAGLSLACASLPAAAADFGPSGGYPAPKSYGSAGVPVPAPAPIPVTSADWYVRADLSYALKSSGTTASIGEFTFAPADPDKMTPYLGMSVAAGRYITPTIRGEISLDYRTHQRFASTQGTSSGTRVTHTTQAAAAFQGLNPVTVMQPVTMVDHYNLSYSEEGQINNYMALASLYYDFKNGSAFTPYVGAGIGVAMHALHRQFSETAVCTSRDYYYSDVAGYTGLNTTPLMAQGCAGMNATRSGEPNATGFGFAAALMTGFAYEMSPGVLLDTGYRFVYQNGKMTSTRPSALGFSAIDMPDRIDHEIRTGLRFDID